MSAVGKGSKEDPEDPEAWGKSISTTGAGGAFVYSDGSLLEGDNVGGGAFAAELDRREQEVICGVGTLATVWDGEVAGMAEGLASIPKNRNGKRVLILADSKAVIAAVRKAGRRDHGTYRKSSMRSRNRGG